LNFEAEANHVSVEEVIREVLSQVPEEVKT
jgi:hypothetical protein